MFQRQFSHNFHIEVSKNAEVYADSKFLKIGSKIVERNLLVTILIKHKKLLSIKMY
jgi:hypothetical protein